MIAIERNAAGIDEEYLQGLSTCFPGAWTDTSYRWYLRRPFRARPPDALSAHDGGAVVGGLGVNYRRLRTPCGRIHEIGLLSAAWTLPSHRGRGCYTRLIEAAIEIGTERGYSALVSFAVVGKPSALGMRRFGVLEVPTHYLSLAPGDPFRPSPGVPVQAEAEPASGAPMVFHYDEPDDWRAQFVDRPHGTTKLETAAGMALLEHVDGTDRLQLLETPPQDTAAAFVTMAAHAHARGCRFFSFTTDRAVAEHAVRCGIRRVAGAILIIALPRGRSLPWLATPWHVQAGDRM